MTIYDSVAKLDIINGSQNCVILTQVMPQYTSQVSTPGSYRTSV